MKRYRGNEEKKIECFHRTHSFIVDVDWFKEKDAAKQQQKSFGYEPRVTYSE